MADTIFVDNDLAAANRIVAAWLNDINNLRYGAGDATRGAALLQFIQSGTGAVARTMQEKDRDVVNAADFATLQQAVTAVGRGQILYIDDNYTLTSGLSVSNKTDVKITGRGTLTLSGASSSAKIFDLVGTIDGLEISDLTFVGEANAAYTQQGIGNTSGQTISNVWILRNKISGCNSGISLNAETTGTYTKAHVLFNNIKDCPGTSAGQGYGIHVNTATSSEIRGNVIDNASRTSILHVSQDCGNIIDGNIVVNHRQTANTGGVAQAIQVMRSSKMRVSNNIIKDCYDGGMLVQHVTSGSESCSDIDVIGNSFINRKNLVSHLYVGESAVPGTYETTHVHVKGNTFSSDDSIAPGGDITIHNGRFIEVSENSFKKTGIAAAATFIIWGDSAAITDAADFTDCCASGNKFVAEGSDLSDVRAFSFAGDVSTGTSRHRFDNREFVGVSYPYRHSIATPTNPNLMVISDHRAYIVGTGASVGAGTTNGKARTNAAVRIAYSRTTASAGSTDNLWDLTAVSTGVGEFRKVLLCLQDAASALILVGDVAASQAAAELPGLPDHRWAAIGVVEIPGSYSGGALGAMTFYDIVGIYEP